ncbi:unnamed protein product [Camellia sinensis]
MFSPFLIPYTKREITSSEVPSLAKDPDGSQSVQNRPQELMKIVKEETKQEELIISKLVKIVTEEIKPAKPTIPESVKTKKEETKPAQPTRPRRAHNVKRMSSVELQAESLLKTKAGHLKDFYNLGQKLEHGQFGTTFLCVEKETRKKYACKFIAKRKLLTKDNVDDVRKEIEIMHHLYRHPNVISIK